MTTLDESLELTPADAIVPLTLAEETLQQRLLTRHAPAWVASGIVHVTLVTLLILLELFLPAKPKSTAAEIEVVVAMNDREEEEKRLEMNEDIGMDPELRANADAERVEEVNVQAKVESQENPGAENASAIEKIDFTAAPGGGMDDAPNPGSVVKDGGVVKPGVGAGTNMFVGNPAFAGRSGAARSALLKSGGGNAESEAAVARGLIWLAKQQKANGSWVFDGTFEQETVAATGMALLPFLAAGQTHKASKDNKYDKTVLAGLKYLIKCQQKDGSLKKEGERPAAGNRAFVIESALVYSHAIGTLALCEALGMSGDTGMLKYPAQRAVNFIVDWQNTDGGWNYSRKSQGGDPSIIGWQIQALQSAKLCKELRVPAQSLELASKYLSKLATGQYGYQFSYSPETASRPSLTAIGLLCRYYLDGWGASNPGMIRGVEYLTSEKNLPNDQPGDLYYFYYATQVVRNYGGKEWSREWNPRMRDKLIASQSRAGASMGSWDVDGFGYIGGCGRLGQTCLSLLTLEVYYRFLPTYKGREAGNLDELERVK